MLALLVAVQFFACYSDQSRGTRIAKNCNAQGSCRAPSYLQVASNASPEASLEQGSETTCSAQCSTLKREIAFVQGTATSISVFPGGCNAAHTNSERPVQVLMNAAKNGYDVSYLEVSTGDYTKLYDIPLSRTTPSMTDINSCAISPIDARVYCTCMLDDFGWRFFIIRVDDTQVELVQEIPQKSICGAIDSAGNFYYEIGKKIYFSSSIHTAQGYPGSLGTATVPEADQSGVTGGQITSKIDGALHDIVVTDADIETPGTMEKVAFYYQSNGATKIGNVGVAMLSGPNKGTSYKLTTKGFLNTCQPSDRNCDDGFGAGWLFRDRIFFSRNNAEGVFELDRSSVNVNQLTATVSKVGESTKTSKNDGMNCMTIESPWTPSPTPSPTPSVSPSPTTPSPTTPSPTTPAPTTPSPTALVPTPLPSAPPPPPTPNCEGFCISHGCKCLIPWVERCKVSSCKGCPNCASLR